MTDFKSPAAKPGRPIDDASGPSGTERGPATSLPSPESRRGRVLIIVQNLSVPFDRRVWLECQALRAAGHGVAVVCPKGPGDASYEKLEGIELYKYRPYTATRKSTFAIEYACSFLATALLALKASRRGHFDVVQACNPPDIFWPVGLLFRALYGSRFVFDHHDLCPELYKSRFPDGPALVHRVLLFLERRTVASADHVIATNASYRAIDVERNGAAPGDVTVVRTGPDPARLRRAAPDPALRRGRAHLVAYIGVMGPQDGVDIVLRVADVVVHRLGREDISFTLMGSGDCFGELVALQHELALDGHVELTGRVPDETVAAVLSSADIGISPDPKNALNDVSTMNKTMEYMAFGLPVVAFDLRETRISAGEAAAYATPNDVEQLAALVVELVDDEHRRKAMGETALARVHSELAWHHQATRYVSVYGDLVARRPTRVLSTARGA
jgi:glycosyltransferase involved in cell wall biosynthesis